MGLMRFRVHQRDRIASGGLARLFVAGSEDIPWSTRTRWDGDLLTVERQVDDSGYLYIPWRVDDHGQMLLNTATLMERDRPYLLDVELARGLLQRLRGRMFVWEWLGLQTPTEQAAELREATRMFASAATRQDDPHDAGARANAAISATLSCAGQIAAAYAQQVLETRRSQSLPNTLLGVTLGPVAPSVKVRRRLLDACNLIQIPMGWRSIESREGRRDWKPTDDQLGWCQAAGLKVSAGPLLKLDDRGVPDWMYLWEGDFDNLARLMLDHVEAVVTRYAGRVHLWHVASRINNGTLLSLHEEQRLNLVAQALHVVRKIDPRTPTVVSFDQPWGEYLADRDEEIAPIQYADALVRADLGLTGFGLEINAGYYPLGTSHRPVFEYGRLLDQWSLLGLPLMLLLSAASASGVDPHANGKIGVEPSASFQPPHRDPQHAWVESIVPLALTRNSVQMVLWNQLQDGEPHEFPFSGLFDSAGAEKPALEVLRTLRKSYLA